MITRVGQRSQGRSKVVASSRCRPSSDRRRFSDIQAMSLTWWSLLALASAGQALDNGLARTPPMGWLSWERFGCNTNCDEDPDSCIGERLLMRTADLLAADGYSAVGYKYVTVDDCWPARTRDSEGRLRPDPRRFPRGMPALARYIHSKGLKLGVYEDVGRHTCAGAPGCEGHYRGDAETFARWGVDMLKFDGCNTDEAHFQYGYPAMARYLNQTGRHVMYSCEWPLYERAKGFKPNYTHVAQWCNTFRVYGDIWDSFQSIMSIVNWYGDNEANFSQSGGPGHFTDADMVVVGNYGLSHDEERVQFGMWAMFPSVLFLSVDLRTVGAESKALLQNRRVIAINQDPLGLPGRRVANLLGGLLQAWVRPVTPSGSYAVAILYAKDGGYPLVTSWSLVRLGLTHPGGYNVTEVFDGRQLGCYKPARNFTCRVNPSGIVMIKATPVR